MPHKVAWCHPILSNIYLHKLDEFVETALVPDYTRGRIRAGNPDYWELVNERRRARRRGDWAQTRELNRRMRGLPSKDPRDPGYRRLRYSRYADDHLLGFTGPRAEAERIKDRLAEFLRDDLKLELSPEKTLITHARTRAARYLGYGIIVQHNDSRVTRGRRGKRRTANGMVSLRVPTDVIKAKCSPYLRSGKPAHRAALQNVDDYNIISTFGAEYRGIVQYYLLAHNVFRLNRLRWVTETSMLKTLAAKHQSTVAKMAPRYRATIATPQGPRVCFEARREREGKQPLVARFGGIPLIRRKNAVLTDRDRGPIAQPRKELIARLLRGRCELCQRRDEVQTHQVRRLADLNTGHGQPAWMKIMAKRRRKTLVVCQPCHDLIHAKPATLTA